jgi:hypothetical protein
MRKFFTVVFVASSFSTFAADFCTVVDMKTNKTLVQKTMNLEDKAFSVAIDSVTKTAIILTQDNTAEVYKTGNLLVGATASEDGSLTLSVEKVTRGIRSGRSGSTAIEKLAIASGKESASLVYFPESISTSCLHY